MPGPISGGSSGTTLTDSASLRAALSDENGTGAALFSGATNPSFAGLTSTSGKGDFQINGALNPSLRLSNLITDGKGAQLEWFSGSGGGKVTGNMVSEGSGASGGNFMLRILRQATGVLTDSLLIDNAGVMSVPGGSIIGSGTSFKNIRHGISGAMVLGSVTITDTGCTANTRYFFSAHTLGTITVPGGYYAMTRNAGASVVAISSQPTETSTLDWLAVEP